MIGLEVKLADLDAIIFDLGGVIINLCYEKSLEQLGQLAMEDGMHLYDQVARHDLFERYEVGQITSGEFRDGLRSLLNFPVIVDETLDAAWNAMLLDIPVARIEQLRLLGQTHRTFVLSNTNEIHMAAFDTIFADSLGDSSTNLGSLVEKVYCSHLMGDRKPNPSIFKTIIAEQSLVLSRTLFIDDTLKHVESARAVGLQSLHLDKSKQLSFESIHWIT